MSDTQGAYSRWYEKNKEDLSQRRKERYHNDPDYRKACLDRRKQQTKASRVEPVPEGYTLNMSEAAEQLDVTMWRLGNWRTKGLFPEPLNHPKGLYFKPHQVQLLQQLKDFYADKGRTLDAHQKRELDGISDLIRANW